MEKATMIGYIYDQPRALRAVFAKRDELCAPFCNLLKNHTIKRIYLTGSGTSYHAAQLMKMYFETYLHIETSVSIPTVFTRYETIDPGRQYQKNEILVLAISQSGTSLSSIEAIRHARKQGCITAALSENLTSLITKEAAYVFHLDCGKEEIPIETRGYTVTVLTALLYALLGAEALHQIHSEDLRQILDDIEQGLAQLEQVLEASEAWYQKNKLALIRVPHASIAGYGYHYITAQEACLKLYETYHQPMSAHELEELIHGYEMAFDGTHYIFMIVAKGPEFANIEKFRNFFDDLTPHHFVISMEEQRYRDHDLYLHVTMCNELTPIALILPFQLMAARNCEAIGYDTSVYPHPRRSFSHKRD